MNQFFAAPIIQPVQFNSTYLEVIRGMFICILIITYILLKQWSWAAIIVLILTG